MWLAGARKRLCYIVPMRCILRTAITMKKIQNWLYANMVGSAQASAVIYSLIETTKENNLNLYQHLFWVLQNAHL